MKLKPDNYMKLLKADEFVEILAFKEGGEVFVDLTKYPRSHYLPVNGDYVLGWRLMNRFNDALDLGITLVPITYDESEDAI